MARILVVEDERIVARDIENVLVRLGHSVTGISSSGAEALQGVESARPDLVLMDIVLPGEMNGIEAAESIRERFHTPVVFLTAYADDATLANAKLASPFGYVLKPFEDGELRTTIQIALHMHRMEEALRASEERYRVLYEDNPSMYFTVTPAGTVLSVNRFGAEQLGYRADELIGQSVLKVFEEADKAAAVAHVAECVASPGRVFHWELRKVRKDGSQLWVKETARAVRSGNGESVVLIVCEDVTPRKRAEEAEAALQESLRRSEVLSAMGSLVAGVAHEVRNPLFGISANLDVLEAKFKNRGESVETISALRGEANRLVSLMQELLDYGRPTSRTSTAVSLDAVFKEAVGACQGLARAGAVEVQDRVAGATAAVLADRQRMVLVFRNLLENAIQHSPPGGRVVITAERTSVDGRSWVVCTLHDSGPGFRTDDLARIFEPFFTRRRGGTGLGLAIAQRVVEEHGGSIAAANRPEGGAVFSVRLPVVE